MALLKSITKLSYQGGWIAILVALAYRLLLANDAGMKLVSKTGLLPRHFLFVSIVLFVICAASPAYAAAVSKKEEPLKARAHSA
jgi:hypothetical protein